MTRFSTLLFLSIVLNCGCSDKKLDVQIVRHSSEILECDKIFAEDLRAIEERNEILLQTGVIDTTSEQPPIRSAIIFIGKNEIALPLIAADTLNAVITEKYQGSDYSLTLTYRSAIEQYNKTVYRGNFLLGTNKSVKKFEVEGKKCVL